MTFPPQATKTLVFSPAVEFVGVNTAQLNKSPTDNTVGLLLLDCAYLIKIFKVRLKVIKVI